MKIHEYNEMMAYLTRPGMRTGGKVIGKPGGLVEPGVTYYGRKLFSSPGYEKLKEWVANQPDGTTLTVDDLKKVAKENNWTDLPTDLDQRMRPSYQLDRGRPQVEKDFWKAQGKRLKFKTAWSAEAIKRHIAGSKKAAEIGSQIQKKAYDIPRSNFDEFVKSWITNNLKNYTPGEFDKFRVDMKNAVLMETGEDVAREARFGRTKYRVEHPALAAPKKVTYFEKKTPVEEIKKLLNEGTPPNEITKKLGVKNSTIIRVAQKYNLSIPSGKQFSPILYDFPNVRSAAAGGSKPFEIFGISQKTDNAKHLPMTFNKIFYKGQLELNPKLKQELIDYIDYINLDKKGTGGRGEGVAQANALEHNKYYTKGVKQILNGLVSQQKKPVISSIVGEKKWDSFAKKTAGNFSTGYKDKVKYLEKLAGYEPGTHTNQMRRLRDGANKMFGFDKSFQLQIKGMRKVKDWLPSYDHLVNISFAAQSKNPVIAKTALDNISIVPAGDNLWVKGFGFDVNSDKWFNNKVYEYENALPGEKLSKLEELKTAAKNMGIKVRVEGGKIIPSPIEDLSKKPLVAKMESYVSNLVDKNPNIINDPDFQLLPKDFREMITKYKGGDPDFLGKFKTKLNELDLSLRELGIKSTDNKNTILNKIQKAPIPKRAKALLLPIVAGAAAITGADLMTGSVEAAEPGQMPQGSPGQLSEDQGLSLQDKAALGTVAVAGAKPAWQATKAVGKRALPPFLSPLTGASLAASEYIDVWPWKFKDDEQAGWPLEYDEKFLTKKENPRQWMAGLEMLYPEIGKQLGSKITTAKNFYNTLLRMGVPIKYAPQLIKGMTGAGLLMIGGDIVQGLDKRIGLEQRGPLTEEEYKEFESKRTSMPRMLDTYEQASKIAKEQGISYEEALKQLDKPNVPGITFNQGGRVGFDEGSKPKSPGRRTFIKGVTALAALPIVGRFFKLGKVLERASGYTGPAIEKIKGMPEWFPSLVKKLWNEGEDVTKKAAYGERQVVKRGTLEGGDDVDMIYQMDTGDVSIQVVPKKGEFSTKSGAYEKSYELEYKKGIGDETTKGTPPDEFGVTEARPVQVGKEDFDWDYDMVDVDEAMTDLSELENFAKKK